ncbi:hypothetical protein F4805DRAFT_410825 [Annulohypoxylon moriforme]|nr:hypothetical protein F4805DRAFT_410825 [Annulohypoxylon moriforme]
MEIKGSMFLLLANLASTVRKPKPKLAQPRRTPISHLHTRYVNYLASRYYSYKIIYARSSLMYLSFNIVMYAHMSCCVFSEPY